MRESSTLNLGAVKEKGIHRVSTVCPLRASQPPSGGLTHCVVFWGAMAHVTVIVLVALATAFQLIGAANAQTPPAPRPSTPEGTRPTPPAPASSEIGARPLTIDECIAIALEGQPTIQERLAAYAAARYRVNQAFAPLLPQLSAQVGAARVRSTSSGGQPQDSQFADTFAAQLLLS